MKTKPKLDMDKIAEGLGAERRGQVRARGGYFGAEQLAAEVQARFKVPAGGGRGTDPRWTEKRLVALAPKTLSRLEHLANLLNEQGGVSVGALQVAALLLERAIEEADETAVEALSKARAS
jgi:hypothetical protein